MVKERRCTWVTCDTQVLPDLITYPHSICGQINVQGQVTTSPDAQLREQHRMLVINACRGTVSLTISKKAEDSDVEGSQGGSKRAGVCCNFPVSVLYNSGQLGTLEFLLTALSSFGWSLTSIKAGIKFWSRKQLDCPSQYAGVCSELYCTLTAKLYWS